MAILAIWGKQKRGFPRLRAGRERPKFTTAGNPPPGAARFRRTPRLPAALSQAKARIALPAGAEVQRVADENDPNGPEDDPPAPPRDPELSKPGSEADHSRSQESETQGAVGENAPVQPADPEEQVESIGLGRDTSDAQPESLLSEPESLEAETGVEPNPPEATPSADVPKLDSEPNLSTDAPEPDPILEAPEPPAQEEPPVAQAEDVFEAEPDQPAEPSFEVEPKAEEPADEAAVQVETELTDEGMPPQPPESEILVSGEPAPEVEPQPEFPEPARAEAPEPPSISAQEVEPPRIEDNAAPDADPVEELEKESPAIAARDADAPLPPHFFRAAGDPDEPPPEPDNSFPARVAAAFATFFAALRAWFEPKYVAFSGALRGFFGKSGRALGKVKPPRNVRETAVWAGWAAGAVLASIVGFFVFVTWGMPSTDDLWEARQGQSITFLDRNGNVILREGAQNAPPVDLNSLPPYVAQAFIAIEDRRFYEHWGVDVSGVMRATTENLRAGRVVQGGSTITQQLAKNLFLTNERSFRRKAQEVAMALWLERRFTKDEILALYLSRVYFGAGAYGVEAAAERYFDRPARELTLLQSAMLAGLVKAPSRLNPARQDIGAARERAGVVLAEMVSMGFISEAERQAVAQEELVISRKNPAGILGYYRDWIDPLLRDVIGEQRDDFIVETTLDIAAQRAGAEAVEAVLAEQGEERRASQGALLAMDDTGGVRAMVGGRDYDTSQFNRTWQARRQPGSAFKFFIYLAAMENGLTPWTVRQDAPIRIQIPGQPDWTPGNYTQQYNGAVSLTTAWAQSYNTVAIRIAREVGHTRVIEAAERLGVRSPLHNYHSLALGAQELTMMDLAQSYGAMASGGYRVYAHGISRVRRANSDETMWSWRAPDRTRVIEERPLRFMNSIMLRTVEAGTGTRARMPGRQIAGKTGTTNDYRDAWFIGFTPGYVAAVWVGNDTPSVMARVTGGSLPAEIWARFAQTALENVPVRGLDLPRDEDFDLGPPDPEAIQSVSVVGAPVGATLGAPVGPPPEDDQDRSLDFGPEG